MSLSQVENKKQVLQSISPPLAQIPYHQTLSTTNKSPLPNHLQTLSKIPHQTTPTTPTGPQNTSPSPYSYTFTYTQLFQTPIKIQILETNFQSIKVNLHYGNFITEISVIVTEIDDRIFGQFCQGQEAYEGGYGKCRRGSFGVVWIGGFEGDGYAVKGIGFELRDGEIYMDQAYKEYFLCKMADVLGVGPKVLPLFGYDILLTKNRAFFAMEECWSINLLQIDLVESQLREALQVLHSIRFIHCDIKPGNIAYSPSLKKYIFIDFGLSKLIREPPGQKTLTKFAGTLSYCSQQMKKCYFFQQFRYIDLYANDLCCLNNTILGLNRELMKRTHVESTPVDESEQMGILDKIIQLIRFKFFIQREDTKEIVKILRNGCKIQRNLYQIYANTEIPKSISENNQVQQRLKIIRKRIFSKNDAQINKIDTMLCQVFCQAKKMKSAQKIIPISQIAQSRPQIFIRYLTKPDLILKLFHFLQPFQKNNFNSIQNKCQLKRAIIDKIYEMKQQKYSGPVFFCEKVRFTLNYFFEKLRELKNVRVLIRLRILFVSIEDIHSMTLLETEIIQTVEEPFLKMLLIAEIYLHKAVLISEVDEDKILRWTKMVENQSIAVDSFRSLKIKSFLLRIMKITKYHNFPYQTKVCLINQIKKISQDCITLQQKQSIYNIKYLFTDLCRLQYPDSSQQPPRGLSMKIYSRHFSTLKVYLNSFEQEEEKLFWPNRYEFQNYFKQQIGESHSQYKIQLKNVLDNQILILKDRKQPLANFMEKIFYLDLMNKNTFYYFLEKLEQEFKISETISNLFIYAILVSINFCLEFIYRNQKKASQTQKIEKQQKKRLIAKLEQIFNKYFSDPRVNQLIAQSSQIKIFKMIIQVKFCFQKGQSDEDVKHQIFAIVNQFKPLPYKLGNLVVHFLALNVYMDPYSPQNCDHYFRRILLQIGSQYIAHKDFSIFVHARLILADYIKINNQKGSQNENLQMLISLIEDFNQNIHGVISKIPVQMFMFAVDVFVLTLHPGKLASIYQQVKLQRNRFECGLFAYLFFFIFSRIRHKLSKPDQLRQVTKTTMFLKYMPSICQIKIKPQLLRLFKYLIAFKSKRKAFICHRMQARSTSDQNRLKSFFRELANKCEKISKKNVDKVMVKLISKISKLDKCYS